MYRKYNLVSIDSWRDDGAWYWNDTTRIEDDIIIHDDSTTPRKLFRFMRRNGWLTEYSKGRIRLDDAWPYLTIEDRGTGEQLLCLIANEDWSTE